jgi:hypothetical protein
MKSRFTEAPVCEHPCLQGELPHHREALFGSQLDDVVRLTFVAQGDSADGILRAAGRLRSGHTQL